MTNWQTPRSLFDKLEHTVGRFAVDAAASSDTRLCDLYYGPGSPLGEDALEVEKWLSPAWCNPPYGRGITQWIDKFIQQATLGVTTVALLPARVDARWWYKGVVENAGILFLVGRVPFVDPARQKPSQPDHASAVCLFEPGFESAGKCSWLEWRKK